jgi:mono/diheme cytochrome c family protein
MLAAGGETSMDEMETPGMRRARTTRIRGSRAVFTLALLGFCAGLTVFAQDVKVTPVSGPSWLKHLNLRLTETTLGRGGAHYGPAPGETAPLPDHALEMREPTTISGADLYRLNCQACHQAEGTGAPPEIKSVPAAVQGATLAAIRKQLRGEGGPPASESAVRQQAAAAEADLLKRIKGGGFRMPAREHLAQRDVDAIFAYVKELSHVDAGPQRSFQTTWDRVGEHVVKGTCHICHDATGARPSPRMILEGAIPPLAVVVSGQTLPEFMRKVRSGAPVMMGDPPIELRGRMRVFGYVTANEAAAAYTYLLTHPPQATAAVR